MYYFMISIEEGTKRSPLQSISQSLEYVLDKLHLAKSIEVSMIDEPDIYCASIRVPAELQPKAIIPIVVDHFEANQMTVLGFSHNQEIWMEPEPDQEGTYQVIDLDESSSESSDETFVELDSSSDSENIDESNILDTINEMLFMMDELVELRVALSLYRHAKQQLEEDYMSFLQACTEGDEATVNYYLHDYDHPDELIVGIYDDVHASPFYNACESGNYKLISKLYAMVDDSFIGDLDHIVDLFDNIDVEALKSFRAESQAASAMQRLNFFAGNERRYTNEFYSPQASRASLH